MKIQSVLIVAAVSLAVAAQAVPVTGSVTAITAPSSAESGLGAAWFKITIQGSGNCALKVNLGDGTPPLTVVGPLPMVGYSVRPFASPGQFHLNVAPFNPDNSPFNCTGQATVTIVATAAPKPPAPKPDLVVLDGVFVVQAPPPQVLVIGKPDGRAPPEPKPAPLQSRWKVKNIGAGPSAPTRLTFSCKALGNLACPYIADWSHNIGALAPGAEQAVLLAIPATGGKLEYTAIVDLNNTIDESNESNNWLAARF